MPEPTLPIRCDAADRREPARWRTARGRPSTSDAAGPRGRAGEPVQPRRGSGEWPELDGRFLRPARSPRSTFSRLDESRVDTAGQPLQARSRRPRSDRRHTRCVPRRRRGRSGASPDPPPPRRRSSATGRALRVAHRQVPGAHLVVDPPCRLRPVDARVVVVLEVAGPGRGRRPAGVAGIACSHPVQHLRQQRDPLLEQPRPELPINRPFPPSAAYARSISSISWRSKARSRPLPSSSR